MTWANRVLGYRGRGRLNGRNAADREDQGVTHRSRICVQFKQSNYRSRERGQRDYRAGESGGGGGDVTAPSESRVLTVRCSAV